MLDSNLKMISMAEVKGLPNGTRVFVRCVGAGWHLEDRESWNIKQEDGLHYEEMEKQIRAESGEETDDEHSVSFAYDFDYDSDNMEIICYIEGQQGCECCMGDNRPVCWKNIKNNVIVDKKGKMVVTVNDKIMKYKVNYCPNCGRKFD